MPQKLRLDRSLLKTGARKMKEKEAGNELSWQWLTLEQMSPQLLYKLLAFRVSIFVVEQACPDQELDGNLARTKPDSCRR